MRQYSTRKSNNTEPENATIRGQQIRQYRASKMQYYKATKSDTELAISDNMELGKKTKSENMKPKK